MAVESTAIAALVAVVRLFYVRVVCDYQHVVVARTWVVFGMHWRRVIHSFANLWHSVFLQVGLILLVGHNLADALSGCGVESTCFLVFSLEEAFSGQGHKKLAVSRCGNASYKKVSLLSSPPSCA